MKKRCVLCNMKYKSCNCQPYSPETFAKSMGYCGNLHCNMDLNREEFEEAWERDGWWRALDKQQEWEIFATQEYDRKYGENI